MDGVIFLRARVITRAFFLREAATCLHLFGLIKGRAPEDVRTRCGRRGGCGRHARKWDPLKVIIPAHQQVDVASAKAKGGHPSDAKPLSSGIPLCGYLQSFNQIKVGVEALEVGHARHAVVNENHGSMDDASHTRRRFQVTDVGLHAGQKARPPLVPARPIGFRQGAVFDWVTELGACAVAFKVVHLRRQDPSIFEGFVDAFLLGLGARCGDAGAPSRIVVGGPAQNLGKVVAIRAQVLASQEHQATAL